MFVFAGGAVEMAAFDYECSCSREPYFESVLSLRHVYTGPTLVRER